MGTLRVALCLLLATLLLTGPGSSRATTIDPPARRLADTVPGAAPGALSLGARSVHVGGATLFYAESPDGGPEPYWSTATANSARLLADICPGRCGSLALNQASPFLAVGTRVFFGAWDGLEEELWVADLATLPPSLTRLDLFPGPDSSFPEGGVGLGTRAVIGARTPLGPGVAVSDGSVAGTARYELQQTSANCGPDPSAFVAAGRHAFFIATTCGEGRELWTTDGGAPRLLSLNPGVFDGIEQQLFVAGERVFFVGSSATDRLELGTSDGTQVRLFNLHPTGSSFVGGGSLIPAGDQLFFVASGGPLGYELGVSDGLTARMFDLNPSGDAFPAGFGTVAAAEERVFFIATNGTTGLELGVSDGANASLFDMNPVGDAFASNTSPLVVAGERAFFVATDGVGGYEPGTSDGSSTALFDLNPAGSSFPGGQGVLVPSGPRAFFVASGPQGRELGVSDGTSARLFDLSPSGDSFPSLTAANLVPSGERVYVSIELAGVSQVAMSDGTTAGVVHAPQEGLAFYGLRSLGDGRVLAGGYTLDSGGTLYLLDGLAATRLAPAPAATGRSPLVNAALAVGRYTAFVITTPALGEELWVSDGTPEGTRPLEINAGPGSAAPRELTVVGDRLFFQATMGGPAADRELWMLDGAAARPDLLKLDLWPDGPSGPHQLTVVGEQLYLTARETADRVELWVVDALAATPTATNLKIGATPGTGGPGSLTPFGDRLVFTASVEGKAATLWSADGQSVAPIPLDLNLYPSHLQVLNGLLYFVVEHPSLGRELGVSDGISAWVLDVSPAGSAFPDPVLLPIPPFVAVDARTCFLATQTGTSFKPVCTDGRTVSWLPFNAHANDPTAPIMVAGGKGYFRSEGVAGDELAVIDGTTGQVLDLGPGRDGVGPEFLTAAGKELLFFANTPSHGREPVLTDGTPGGTRVLDLEPGPVGSQSQFQYVEPVAVGETLFFSAATRARGLEPVALRDGQVTLLDVNPDLGHAAPFGFTVVRGGTGALFQACTKSHGCELWASDGSVAGTALVADLAPGPTSSMPETIVEVGTGATAFAFLFAEDSAGREPWSVPLTSVRVAPPEIATSDSAVQVTTGGTVTGQVRATDADFNTLRFDIAANGMLGTATIDAATGLFRYTAGTLDEAGGLNALLERTDRFVVRVSDGLRTAEVAITVTIGPYRVALPLLHR